MPKKATTTITTLAIKPTTPIALKKKRKRRSFIAPTEFVRQYMLGVQKGKKGLEIAKACGISQGSFYGKVNQLKKKGVKLPNLNPKKRHEKINVSQLNRLIAEFSTNGKE